MNFLATSQTVLVVYSLFSVLVTCFNHEKPESISRTQFDLTLGENPKERTIELYLNPYDPLTRMASIVWAHVFSIKPRPVPSGLPVQIVSSTQKPTPMESSVGGNMAAPSTTSLKPEVTPTNTFTTISASSEGLEIGNMVTSTMTPDNAVSTLNPEHSELLVSTLSPMQANEAVTDLQVSPVSTSPDNATIADTVSTDQNNITTTIMPDLITSSLATPSTATADVSMPSTSNPPGVEESTNPENMSNMNASSVTSEAPQSSVGTSTISVEPDNFVPEKPLQQAPENTGPIPVGQFPTQHPQNGGEASFPSQNFPPSQFPPTQFPGQNPNQPPIQQGPGPFPPNEQQPPPHFPGQQQQPLIPPGSFPGQNNQPHPQQPFPGQQPPPFPYPGLMEPGIGLHPIPPQQEGSQFPPGGGHPFPPQGLPPPNGNNNVQQPQPTRPPKNPFANKPQQHDVREMSTEHWKLGVTKDTPGDSTTIIQDALLLNHELKSDLVPMQLPLLPVEEKRKLSSLHRIYAVIHGE